MKYTPFIITTLALVLLAGVTRAYYNPTVNYNPPQVPQTGTVIPPINTGNGEIVPITTGAGAADDSGNIKSGGLTLKTFLSLQDTWIQQQSFFPGTLSGGSVSSSEKIKFGELIQGISTSVTATGGIQAYKNLQSDTLTAGGRVCADSMGTLTQCIDLCPSLEGMQTSIPMGYHVRAGDCEVDDDTSTPAAASCEYQMIVTRVDATHANFNLYHGVGSNYTYDASGTGHMAVTVKNDAGTMLVYVTPHGQATGQIIPSTTHLSVTNVAPQYINGGEICWLGY